MRLCESVHVHARACGSVHVQAHEKTATDNVVTTMGSQKKAHQTKAQRTANSARAHAHAADASRRTKQRAHKHTPQQRARRPPPPAPKTHPPPPPPLPRRPLMTSCCVTSFRPRGVTSFRHRRGHSSLAPKTRLNAPAPFSRSRHSTLSIDRALKALFKGVRFPAFFQSVGVALFAVAAFRRPKNPLSNRFSGRSAARPFSSLPADRPVIARRALDRHRYRALSFGSHAGLRRISHAVP